MKSVIGIFLEILIFMPGPALDNDSEPVREFPRESVTWPCMVVLSSHGPHNTSIYQSAPTDKTARH